MQIILNLVAQLYDNNEGIRMNAEAQLNNHHHQIANLYTALDTVLTLRGAPQLQYFMYLKHFIQTQYEHSPNYIQRELQQYLINQIPKIDKLIQHQFCQLLLFIIQQTLPDCGMINSIIEYKVYDATRIQIITLILNTGNIKFKVSRPKYVQITQKMLLFYDLTDATKLELLVDLYRACTRQIYFLGDEIHGQIIVQFCQCLQFQPKQYEVIRKFCKAILNFNAIKPPNQDLQTLLYNTLLNYLNYDMTRRLACYVLKLLQQTLRDRQIKKEEETILLEFVFSKVIMLSQNEYRQQFNQSAEDEDYLLLKLRKYGTDFLHFLITYFNEEQILDKILNIRIDDSCIMKEARYFVISEISFVPASLMDMLFIQELIMIVQNDDIMFMPVQIQALNLIMKLQLKNMIDTNQILYLIAIINKKFPGYMLQPLFLCKMVDVLISFHNIIGLNDKIYKDLKILYSMQQIFIVKETILKCMIRTQKLGQGDNSHLEILIQEWKIGLQEPNQYKYQMVLNVLEEIDDTQIILTIISDCLFKKIHQQQCLSILISLLKRLIQKREYQFDEQLLQIHKLIVCDPEYFEDVLQAHILFLIAEVANPDVVFDFISNFTLKLQSSDSLSLLCILFSTLHGHETQIVDFYRQILKEMIFDGGKTYSELICALSILDIRGYDVKELWIKIRGHVVQELTLGTFIQKATTYILQNKEYYVNYYKRLFNSLLDKHHLMFDMEYLSLNVGLSQQISTVLGVMQQQNTYDYLDAIKNIFQIKFSCNIKICPELAKKFTIPEQSVELDLQQLQIK